MPGQNGPQIQPATVAIGTVPVQFFTWVDPAQFPEGLTFSISKPGSPLILGEITVKPGCMVGVAPPELADALLPQARRQKIEAGKKAGPGLGG